MRELNYIFIIRLFGIFLFFDEEKFCSKYRTESKNQNKRKYGAFLRHKSNLLSFAILPLIYPRDESINVRYFFFVCFLLTCL